MIIARQAKLIKPGFELAFPKKIDRLFTFAHENAWLSSRYI
jgi:hypothetical protein